MLAQRATATANTQIDNNDHSNLFRERLTQRRDHLLQSLADNQQGFRDASAQVTDEADQSSAMETQQGYLSIIQRANTELKRIGNALRRLSRGEYGECSDCGADIGKKRLEADPSAERCIHCQEIHEIKGRHRAA